MVFFFIIIRQGTLDFTIKPRGTKRQWRIYDDKRRVEGALVLFLYIYNRRETREQSE